jgi:isopenicillin N synthase-like dioxygenase
LKDIPTIDFADLDHASMRDVLDRACREWGFFYLTGHGIDKQVIGQMLAVMQCFFALPSAQKKAVERTVENPWGFYDRELTKNVRDWKEIFDVGPNIPTDARGLSGPMSQARGCKAFAAVSTLSLLLARQ